MQRFRKLLVAINPSDKNEIPNSLLRAIKLARNTGAELEVVGVIPQFRNLLRSWVQHDTDAEELVTRRFENRISRICEDHAEDIEYSISILRGRTFVELIREANSSGCDLIVKSAENTAGTPLLGSADFRLMQNSPVPVWIVKSRPVPVYERVLVAIDPFAESDEEMNVNRRLLELASSLSEWESADLYVVAACEVQGEELLLSSMGPGPFEEHVERLAAQGRRSVDTLLKELPNSIDANRVNYQIGTPSVVIVDFAGKIDADIILLGTLTKNTLSYLMVGNTASEVLRRVHHSVMTIKPQGFESPVL